jgi:integral membrane protein
MASTMNSVSFLRRTCLLEGWSFLLLLGIAMPLKYFAGMPIFVKVLGWAHGVLFVIFGLALLRAMASARWPISRGAVVFIASLLPFGPFLLDGKMKEWEAQGTSSPDPV